LYSAVKDSFYDKQAKLIGPVCLETEEFEATIATRLGFSGLEISMDALRIARFSFDSSVDIA
jgi:hypothetical protein